MTDHPDKWLSVPRPIDDPALRLFCFPYAGGNAAIYKPWIDLLPPTVELQAIQLPGRGNRMKETPIENVDEVTTSLIDILEPLTDVPFAFYGHSMGALLAFEMTKRLWEEFRLEPTQLFVAARRAPHLVSRNQTLHEQPSQKIRDFLKSLRAVPPEVLDNDELMELLLPTLRADLKLDTLYDYTPGTGVGCPILAFTGKDDEYVSQAEITGWGMHAGGGFELLPLPGDHFFMDHPVHRLPLLKRITTELASHL